VDGHASTEGKGRFNLNLSKRRREAVIALLNSELKTQVKFDGMPYGESKVAVAETAEKGDPELERQRSLNRRVEVKIISSPIFEPKKPIDLSLPVKPPSAEEELNRSIKILNELDKKGELKPFKQKIGVKDILDKVLDKINVPDKYRGLIKKGIEAVGEKALDKYLDQTDLNKNEKKMIKKLIDGLYKYQFEF
jgi:hypothetical protein